MLPRLFSLVSFDSFLALITLAALQYFPIPGVFLMIFGAALITGLLVHVFLASLFIEALIRRVPRVLALVPILAYGGYYVTYLDEAHRISVMNAELQAANPGRILDFDPKLHSIVMDQAQEFVKTHDVPVVYALDANYPEAHLSYRLITRDQCSGIVRDTQNRVLSFGVLFNGVLQKNICLLRFPERPANKTVTVTVHGGPQEWKRDGTIRQEITEISIDVKSIGSFTTASIWRLPVFPTLLIGCVLNSGAPRWECFANFWRTNTSIGGAPASIDRAQFDDPVSVMLGIRKYAAADLSSFSGFDANAAALDYIREEAVRVEDKVFNVLRAIVDGENPKPTFNLGYSLATNPERLAPLAQDMTRRFGTLAGSPSQTPNRRAQLEALAMAIGALPHETFLSVALSLFEVVKADQSAWNSYPMIYVRVGEAGITMLPFYRDQFLSNRIRGWMRVLPVLALCRIGTADTELIEELKERYVAVDLQGGGQPNNYKTALFVTLLKLGQKPFLETNHPANSPRDAWYAQVLASKGLTKTGPNNCMPQTFDVYATPEVAPSLRWTVNGWQAQKS